MAAVAAVLAGSLGLEGSGAAFNRTTANSANSFAAGTWASAHLIDAGARFACMVMADTTVECWGRNNFGQLGDNTATDRSTPIVVKGSGGTGTFTGATTIGLGKETTCAVKTDATVWCWGQNDKGQVGNGTTSAVSAPVQVKGVGGTGFLTGVKTVVAGEKQTCAMKTDGTVWCWGQNNAGQLGNATIVDSLTPVQVKGAGGTGTLTGVADIGSGKDHFCAVLTTGALWCWGTNGSGQLGDGTVTNQTSPVQVKGAGGTGTLANVRSVDGGENHTCANLTDNTVWCWGANDKGQLGDGSTTTRAAPVQVKGVGGTGTLTGVTAIGTGRKFGCAVLSTGQARCWGEGGGGNLGNNTTTDSTTPVVVQQVGGGGALTGVTDITGGQDSGPGADRMGCARITSTTARCWGENSSGQLGDATTTQRLTPVAVLL